MEIKKKHFNSDLDLNMNKMINIFGCLFK